MKLTLKPLGPVDPGVVAHLRESLGSFGEVAIAAATALPSGVYEADREQYRASRLFDVCLGESGDRVLGVTEADLYEDGLDFVFGYAQIGDRVAVISTARLRARPRRSQLPPAVLRRTRARREERFLGRCVKEAVHELGHTLGLTHDDRDPQCVMYYSHTLADTDRKGPSFCSACASRADLTLRRLGK